MNTTKIEFERGSPEPSSPPTFLDAGDAIGRFEVIRELGRGGMGAVYLGKNRDVDLLVAIKVLPPALAFSDPDYAARFLREAKLAATLVDPHIIKMVDCGLDQSTGLYYLVQEFVHGCPIKDKLDVGPIPEEQA